MKKLTWTIIIVLALAGAAGAQTINWRSYSNDQRTAIQLNAGYDYGATLQLGCSRMFTLLRPVVVGLEYSVPMGKELTDDFKVKLGGQVEIVQLDGFSAAIRVASTFRRYESSLVRIAGFGADCGLLAGYYHPSWFAAGEFGFDKAIATHLRHSDLMRSAFPGVRDGWYVPTGGHFYYGVQGGTAIGGSFDLTLRGGATSAQFTDEDAAVPYYLQLGLGVRL